MVQNSEKLYFVCSLLALGACACESDGFVINDDLTPVTEDRECTKSGELRCFRDGTIAVCRDGVYTAPTADDLCSTGTFYYCVGEQLKKRYCQACGSINGAPRCLDCSSDDNCETATCRDGICSGNQVVCRQACSVRGELVCDGNGYRTCIEKDGCRFWSDIRLCNPDEKCDHGICESDDIAQPCQNECTSGTRQCAGTTAYIECRDTNVDGCTEWANASPCPQDTTCNDGECTPVAPVCQNQCTAGSKQCSANTIQECKDANGDGCTEWISAKTCTNGQACQNGECKSTCQNQCTAGAKQCSANTVQECKDANGDGCTEWTSAKTCASDEKCTNAACVKTSINVPVRYLETDLHSPITAYVVTQMKNIAAKSTNKRNNVFMKIGDSHYDYSFDGKFMKCFSNATSDAVTLGGRTELQAAITAFQATTDSFNRDSEAAKGGMSTRYSFLGSPTHLSAEISAMRPRFAFFGHGSNDMGNGSYCHTGSTCPGGVEGYAWALQDYYRQIDKVMTQLIGEGIIPLISGITPRNDKPSNINYIGGGAIASTSDYPTHMVSAFNAVTRGNAEALQVPFFNVHRAVVGLSNNGLRTSDNIHTSFSGSPCNFSAEGLKYGAHQRNLGSLQMLHRAWNVIANNAAAPDSTGTPFEGAGTASSPFIISSLPFTHSANTKSGGKNVISNYAGKCSTTSECGNEFYYRLVLNAQKRLRMFAVSASGVDADIHIMRSSATAASCIARSDIMIQGTFPKGTYYISVDSYCTNGTPTPGKYLLGIVECDSDDNNCNTVY